MPLYVADYLGDTQHLTTLEHGVYLLLLMHYWRVGALPVEDRKLATICRLSMHQWRSVRPTIAAFFRSDWTHDRLEIERKAYENAKAANAKNGKRGGEAKALKNKERVLATATKTGKKSWRNSSENVANSELRTQEEGSNEPSYDPSVARATSGLSTGDAVDLFGIDKIPKAKDADAKGELLAFGSAWNDMAAKFKLAAIDFIRPGTPRERHALARLRELHKDYSSDGSILVGKVRGSPYLRGEINGFRCTFDWMINPQNFQKIMEGNYEGSTKDHKERHQGYR